jgi:uncharacterized protein involved in oxidation of intracellular sulfur
VPSSLFKGSADRGGVRHKLIPCSGSSSVKVEMMVQEVLIVINDAPYGTEKAYNALRLSIALQSRGNKVDVFLMADAVYCGLPRQETPQGYYNISEMLGRVLAKGGRVAACGSCMKARGLSIDGMVKGVEQGSMALLSEWTEKCDKIHSF